MSRREKRLQVIRCCLRMTLSTFSFEEAEQDSTVFTISSIVS